MVLRVAMSPCLEPLPEWVAPADDRSEVAFTGDMAKQRATVKWLLSKAFNNRVPENLREPFYRDHEDQEHLKPPIIGTLANAELYCLALSNVYSDPNYHNLNHWNILQTLIRKGIQVADPPDCTLTETVLIQTNPLKMSAHMAVMESLMLLYGREVGTRDRVSAAIRRWGGRQLNNVSNTNPLAPHEEALLVWISSACEALRQQQQDNEESVLPTIPAIESLRDLCDGVALAALVSLYCPDALPISQIRAPRLASVHDSIHNLTLVYNFCQKHLPYNVFHMMPEDITYMRGSMHQNLLVMLADLFNMLEIHPAKCVRFPGSQNDNTGVVGVGAGQSNLHGVVHKRCLPPAAPVPIPDLRSGLHTPPPHLQPFTVTRSPSASLVSRGRSIQMNSSGAGPAVLQRSACSTPERRSASPQHAFMQQDDGFVVHRGRAVPTLSSVVRQSEDSVAAGRPSNWEEQRRSSYAGRRSRRGSINAADDSQLTVENFGGSQDRLNFVGRNPEKELATVGGHNASPRKISAPAAPVEQCVPVRSSLQDARGSIEMFYNDTESVPNYVNKRLDDSREKFLERQYSKPEDADRTIENQYLMKRQLSSDTISSNHNISGKTLEDLGNFHHNNNKDVPDGEIPPKLSSFADLTKFRGSSEQSGIQLVYMQPGKEENNMTGNNYNRFQSGGDIDKKITSFGASPNTTTWQQQSLQNEQHLTNCDLSPNVQDTSPINNGNGMAAQLNNIRLKLEEKKRRIEHEKRRMEMALNRQRQQVGQQAFLQAVSKNKGIVVKSSVAPGTGDNMDVDDGSSGASVPAMASGISEVAHSFPSPSHTSNPARPVTLQDISSDVQSVENKWLDQDGSPFIETRRTPDLDGMALEDYHQSIAKMNCSLQDIQTDIARLASQQNQIQANQFVHQQSYQPSHIPQSLHNQYGSQHNVNSVAYGLQHSNFGSSPHIPPHDQQMSSSPHRHHQMDSPQFYLHERQHMNQPTPPPRRTWAQQAQINHSQDQRVWQSPHNVQHQQPQYQDVNPQRGWSSSPVIHTQPQELRTWGNPQGFVLHEGNSSPYQLPANTGIRYQNGSEHNLQNSNLSYTLSSPSQPQQSHLAVQSLFTQQTPPTASPQHRAKTPQRQQSLSDLSRQQGAVSLQQLSSADTIHTPIKALTVDDMEPQNISFIGNAEDEALQQGIGRLNITSGSRTYRIPSPTRPSLTRNSFQQPLHENSSVNSMDQGEPAAEKGFYISFDSEQPKRPKPPLRVKRGSPKKDRTPSNNHSPEREGRDNSGDDQWQDRVKTDQSPFINQRNISTDHSSPSIHRDVQSPRVLLPSNDNKDVPAAIIIGGDLSNPNPETAEEMEKKKERIMMLSLQRRQQAEEARARSEAAAEARRQREANIADERAARKEYQAQRRDAILQQYKLKKAIEEAEREGKVFDKSEFMSSMKPAMQHANNNGTMGGTGGGAKLRPKAAGAGGRARPKTIHVDSGAVQMAEGILTASRGKQGSSSNLTAGYNQQPSSQSTMRRDYYRGSQDSLADRAGLYRDSPIDESRGISPGSGASALGRRGSYKTSRENINAMGPQTQTRGRSKYSTYQNNFKTGRKSSSLMNLCGSSSDQDSMVLRYGDADSGLGRATPPRRAPSPGIRTLPSPSGPGSLPPGLMTKRRTFDDGSSDISSTPSSIMDYSGPRLYKQPATKSNRGIMLNAVEYCVFPGVVNKDAKLRVIDEINNTESKHFLVLFRDAGLQFRALYSYCPDREDISKLYGTGPRQVNDRMFDKFFKYNSGSKCFSQVHTKHLTVTIDAFTIHNSLWQGKKVQLPSKKDMTLVI